MDLHSPLSDNCATALSGFEPSSKLFLSVCPWGKAAREASEGILDTETVGCTHPPRQIGAVTQWEGCCVVGYQQWYEQHHYHAGGLIGEASFFTLSACGPFSEFPKFRKLGYIICGNGRLHLHFSQGKTKNKQTNN